MKTRDSLLAHLPFMWGEYADRLAYEEKSYVTRVYGEMLDLDPIYRKDGRRVWETVMGR